MVSHIKHWLMQQKIATQSKALEIVMKLEASPIDETIIGMSQIQEKLLN